MTDNNTHSVLFELQKNLEDLSSAKEQVDFFRDKSLEITNGISLVQRKYVEHLQGIKSDYESRVRDLKNELTSFSSKIENENKQTIQKFVSKSEETIGKGIEKFETASKKVESSNNEKIEAINSLLKHYKNVVEASNSLIETLTAIDFPTKLDVLSSKSQLIIESITSAKQALEIKLIETQNSIVDKTNTVKEQIILNNDSKINSLTDKITEANNNVKQALEIKLIETQNSIIDKTNTVKEQIILNNDNKINSLTDKITEANNNVKTIISTSFEEQSKHTKTAFDNLNTLVEKQFNQTKEQLDKQDKEIRVLKILLSVAIGIILIGIVLKFVPKISKAIGGTFAVHTNQSTIP